MTKLEVTVNGVRRNVYIEQALATNKWRARVYVGSRVVSGTLTRNSVGVYRFNATGVNAGLVK